MAYKNQQVKTKNRTAEWMCKSKYFQRGVFDAALGEPFDSSYDLWKTDDQWNYERGRIFAITCPETPLLRACGKRLTPEALSAVAHLVRTHIII